MPIDKQPNGPTNKPVTPALSSRFRTNKTPFAPRLAGAASASPPATARKDLRDQTLSPPSQHSRAQNLSDNITPRSGARNIRIGTESPASPATNRRWSGSSSFVQTILPSARPIAPVKSPGSNTLNHARAVFNPNSPNTSASRRLSGSSSVSKKDEEPTKFVRADDAKLASTVQNPKSTLSPRPLVRSFLKSGSPRSVNSAPPSTVHSATDNKKDQKFPRANDARLAAGRPAVLERKLSTTSMTSTNPTKSRPPEPSRVQSHPPPLRKQPSIHGSPVKTPLKPSNTPVSPPKQTSIQPASLVTSPHSPSVRRPSFGSNISSSYPVRPMLHRKSNSVSSFRPPSPKFTISPLNKALSQMESVWISPSVTIPMPNPNLAIPSPDTLSPRSASLASSKTVGTSVTSDTDVSEVSKVGPPYPTFGAIESHQPQHVQLSPLAQAQANAANARRERKVLDLEISNSSLLAINKTLEKELRKQSAELRRFRRLSRSGRLSFAPSNRSISGASALSLDTLQEQTENDDDDFSDGEEEESDVDEFEENALDGQSKDFADGLTAGARQRARDERRLMLDLSKHQELLIDSQKLSQSIRKCLNMSEDLIKEANQALKYKVGIGDVKIGGRVLSAEDFDADNDGETSNERQDSSRQALLSPSIRLMDLQEEDLWQVDLRRQDEVISSLSPHSSNLD